MFSFTKIHRINFISVIILLWGSALLGQDVQEVIGHAHNDYEHPNPLFDALTLGFRSIEVDIHYRKGELIVSHGRNRLSSKPTLEKLYLEPLDSLVKNDRFGMHFKDGEQLTLMIDLKTKKKKLLKALNKALLKYDHLLQKRTDTGGVKWGPIRILISGNPPLRKWKKVKSPYFYLDGRIGKNYPEELKGQVLRISSSLKKVISVKHLLDQECSQYNDFVKLVKSIYSKGHDEVRFWASPDEPEVWKALIAAGVNVVSVDALKKFNTFSKSTEGGL